MILSIPKSWSKLPKNSQNHYVRIYNLKTYKKSPWGEQPIEDISIFICACMSVCVYVRIFHESWLNEKLYRPEIWYTRSPRPHLKMSFSFFWKVTLRVASLEKLPCHSCGFSAYLLDCLLEDYSCSESTDSSYNTSSVSEKTELNSISSLIFPM